MLTLLDSKLTVHTREPLYGDWRDWFVEKNTKQKVHETKLLIYFDKECIHEMMVPINIKKLHCDMDFITDKNILIDAIRYVIPEMGFIKEATLCRNIEVGDNINFSGNLEFFE